MTTNQVEKLLEESSPVVREDETHEEWFEERAVEEEGEIPVNITGIQATESFTLRYYDRMDDIDSRPEPVSDNETIEEAEEKWEKLTDNNPFDGWNGVYGGHGHAVDRESSINLELEMPEGSYKTTQITNLSAMEYPEAIVSLMKNVRNQTVAEDFTDISDDLQVEAWYEFTENEEILKIFDGEERQEYSIKTEEGGLEIENRDQEATEREYGIAEYFEKTDKRPEDWVEYEVINLLDNDSSETEDKLLLVNGPEGDTLFELKDDYYEMIVDELGQGDPAEVSYSSVYLRSHPDNFRADERPRDQDFGDNVDEYALTKDVNSRWQLAIERPNYETNQNERGLKTKIEQYIEEYIK